MLKVILAAIGLFFILEGLFPSLSPIKYKKFISQLLTIPDKVLQNFGFVLIVIGLIIIFIVTHI